MPTASSSRVKREECARTKHDSVFSKWKVLIGPSDWEDYYSGKEGVERYMIHNLPAGCSCPGLYELGVAAISNSERLRSRKRTSYKITVVYLGEADNLRARLQHYGRAGSHLDHGNKIKTFGLQRGPGLFKDMFSRGYSILFRWAPMANKKEAERMEAQLLGVFDYAWNSRGNGSCRREDILSKLDNAVRSPVHTILVKLRRWKRTKFGKKVGIKITTSWPLGEIRSANDRHGFRLPHVFKFDKSRHRSVPGDDSSDTNRSICGVARGDGSVCRNRPVDGRKRCIEHKGKKISGTKSVPTRKTKAVEGNSSVCSLVSATKHEKPDIELQDLVGTAFMKRCSQLVRGDINTDREYDIDGSSSSSSLVSVRKWSEMHEGHNDAGPKLATREECNVCGVVTADGYVCRRVPVSGRKMCEDHKGLKKEECNVCGVVTALGDINTDREYDIDGSSSSSSPVSVRKWSEMHEGHNDAGPKLAMREECNVCGVVTADGYVCRRVPVSGRKMCEDHKGLQKEECNVCGVVTADGYVCRRVPVSGRKRCEDHKGLKKANRVDLIVTRKISVQKFGLCECGVWLEDGSICTNSPVPARKRCELHKGMRLKTLYSTIGNLSDDFI